MKTAQLKFPASLCGKVYPKGEIVELVKADDLRVQKIFPNIKENKNSKFIFIRFLDRETITLSLVKQLIIE